MRELVLLAFVCQGFALAEDSIKPELLKATLRLRAETGHGTVSHGTAVCIDAPQFDRKPRKYLLTALHVVAEGSRNIAVCVDSAWISCAILESDEENDIALLECSAELPGAVPLSGENPKAGDSVLLIGCPADVPPSPYRGYLSDCSENRWFAALPFYHGDSGAPVFFHDALIGIAVAGVGTLQGGHEIDMCQTVGLFVPLKPLKALLSGEGAPKHNKKKG